MYLPPSWETEITPFSPSKSLWCSGLSGLYKCSCCLYWPTSQACLSQNVGTVLAAFLVTVANANLNRLRDGRFISVHSLRRFRSSRLGRHSGILNNENVWLGFLIFQWSTMEWFITPKGLLPVAYRCYISPMATRFHHLPKTVLSEQDQLFKHSSLWVWGSNSYLANNSATKCARPFQGWAGWCWC